MILATPNGSVNLYYDAVKKFETTATGATVTGTIAVSGDFNATSGTFTVQSNGTDILNVTSTLMSPQTDGAISIGSASNAFNDLHLGGSATISGITYPTSDGSSGQFLKTDGSGNLSFATVSTTVGINDLTDGYAAGGSVGLGGNALDNDDGSANNNTAVGTNSGSAITSGNNNTLVGWSSGQRLTTGRDNTAIGYTALEYSLDAETAVAVGRQALYGGSNNRHVGNVGIGYRAGFKITTGQNNVFLGIQSGYNTTSAGNNFFGGRQAGYLNSTGQQNIFLGANAGYTNTTGSNNVVIGYDVDASSATVSNEVTLGNNSINRVRIPGAGIDNTSAALSGTSPSVNVGARDTYTLTTSGNTTFSFTNAPASPQVGTFSLIITAGGTHTLTWPSSVDWADGTAPDAPASGAKDVYTFMTINAGSTWYGFLSGAAMA
jgi:hypothetical protein